jgi:hypothetical protein
MFPCPGLLLVLSLMRNPEYCAYRSVATERDPVNSPRPVVIKIIDMLVRLVVQYMST